MKKRRPLQPPLKSRRGKSIVETLSFDADAPDGEVRLVLLPKENALVRGQAKDPDAPTLGERLAGLFMANSQRSDGRTGVLITSELVLLSDGAIPEFAQYGTTAAEFVKGLRAVADNRRKHLGY